MLFENQKADQTLAKVFINAIKRQKPFKYPANLSWSKPECAKSKAWLKLPIRSSLCTKQYCVYNYDQNVKSYNCQFCSKTPLENMYVDLRLASILTKALEYLNKYEPNPKKISVLGKYTTLMTNQLGNLKIIITLNKVQRVFQQNELKDQSYMNMNQGSLETKLQIGRSYKIECEKYFESKKQLKKLSQNLEKEVKQIVKKVDSKSIINEITNSQTPKRIIYKNQFLFGFSKGELYIYNGTKIENKIIVGVEQDFRSFHGASWFSTQNDGINIYAVGGNSIQKTYSKGLISFRLDSDKFAFKQINKNNSLLDLLNTAVVYVKQKNIAYAFGGINGTNLVPEQSIIQINLNTNTVSKIGNLSTSKFNHCAIRYDRFIYIVGGIDYNRVKEQSPKLDIQKAVSSFNYQHLQKNIEIFNIDTKQISLKVTHTTFPDLRRIFYRSVPVMAFSNEKKYIVLFGGNHGNNLQQKKSIALDLTELSWSEYGDNLLAIRFQVGEDKIVSTTMNIIDFEGWQTENSTKFLHISGDGSKKSEIIFTTQGAQNTYRWKF